MNQITLPPARLRLGYTPTMQVCLTTRGTLQNGKPSKACYWSTLTLRQVRREGMDGYYHYDAETGEYNDVIPSPDPLIHQNPLIYYKPHLIEHAEYYKAKLADFIQGHFKDIEKVLKRKKLRAPFVTVCQAFDELPGRHVLYAFPNPVFPIQDNVDALWRHVVQFQSHYKEEDGMILKETVT